MLQGIAMLNLGSTQVGMILLWGLFFYDIFWVFFTPVMVTVAKNIDGPIKLLFPTASSWKHFNMLGLGDIVIPGEPGILDVPDCAWAVLAWFYKLRPSRHRSKPITCMQGCLCH